MSDQETMKINDVQYVRADSIKTAQPADSEYFIVRGNRSGVFFGLIEKRDGVEVTLRECIRIWYWSGANSLSELSAKGTSKPSDCKFPVAIDSVTVLDAIEVIPCTEQAVKSIQAVTPWEQ